MLKKQKAKKTIKKVVKGLTKASKLHAGQAKSLKAIKLKSGGSTVNAAGNYTKPTMRKRIFNRVKAGGKGGAPGQWSARKAQMVASAYKKAGGGYRG
jgi:hypothetical protein